jgi:SAM-dependent methyltransferase
VAALNSTNTYDLIWAGSVLTHLPEAVSKDLIHRLFSWLRPTGVLVMSFHGRFAAMRGPQFGSYGLEIEWSALLIELATKGFAYADYPNQKGYGISLSTLGWITSQVQRLEEARLVLLAERAWDDHQDVFGFQLRSISEAL